jgi:hypothetical protein
MRSSNWDKRDSEHVAGNGLLYRRAILGQKSRSPLRFGLTCGPIRCSQSIK